MREILLAASAPFTAESHAAQINTNINYARTEARSTVKTTKVCFGETFNSGQVLAEHTPLNLVKPRSITALCFQALS